MWPVAPWLPVYARCSCWGVQRAAACGELVAGAGACAPVVPLDPVVPVAPEVPPFVARGELWAGPHPATKTATSGAKSRSRPMRNGPVSGRLGHSLLMTSSMELVPDRGQERGARSASPVRQRHRLRFG